MAVDEVELAGQLKQAGNKLLDPPSSVSELLATLDDLVHLLINVEQAPSRSVQDALLLPMRALISTALLRHEDADVKLSVTSCFSEITRITAPDAPYSDDLMKEFFQLTVAAFEKLSHVSGRAYVKAASILETVARVRSCLVMLDLELDELIVVMFKHFLKCIRSNHVHDVPLAMETIMTFVISESEDLSIDLLTPLLASVRKQNQRVSPMAWKLGENVMTNCASKLKHYLKEAVQSIGIAEDEYSPIVASICQDETPNHDQDNDPKEQMVKITEKHSGDAVCPGEVCQQKDVTPKSAASGENASAGIAGTIIRNNLSKTLEHCSVTETRNEVKLVKEEQTVPQKRGWKPNFLMNPEEGYYHSWRPQRKRGKGHQKGNPDEKINDSPVENPVSRKASWSSSKTGRRSTSSPSPKGSLPSGLLTKGGCAKRKMSPIHQGCDSSPPSASRQRTLTGHVEEKVPQSGDVNLMKQSERSKSKQQLPKRSRKFRSAIKTAEETSLDSENEAIEIKPSVLREPKEVPASHSVGVGFQSKGRDRSSIEEIKKMSSGRTIHDDSVTEASAIKKASLDETSKPKPKRKRSPSNEVPLETPGFGKDLIGSRIKVLWPLDERYYEGVVRSYDPMKMKHRVCYEDGEAENLNLRKEQWQLVDNGALENKKVQKTSLPTSSDILQKVKGKTSSEPSKKLKANSSSKRSVTEGTPQIKVRRSRGKYGNVGIRDKPIAVIDQPEDSNLDGKGNKKTRKVKVEEVTTDNTFEQAPPEIERQSNDGSPKADFCGMNTEQLLAASDEGNHRVGDNHIEETA